MGEADFGHRDISSIEGAERRLLVAVHLYTADAVLRRPSPVPQVGGVYAWYFDKVPPEVPTAGCHVVDDLALLYVGISPKAPSADGTRPSRQTLRSRLRGHLRGNAYGSTLRLSLGSLLADELGLALRRVGSGKRLTFGRDGETVLSQWMAEHARIVWAPVPTPWLLEDRLIQQLVLPLNLDRNRHSPFREHLSALRRRQRDAARSRPTVPPDSDDNSSL